MERIIIIGHGSPLMEANNLHIISNMLHRRVHPDCQSECVKMAYLQFGSPDLMEAIHSCIDEGAVRIIIHPYFLNSGMHVTKDIPEIIEIAKKEYPAIEFVYTEPIGVHNLLTDIIFERIEKAMNIKPKDIEKKSFDIISKEIDLTGIPHERIPVIKRVIHATGDFEYRDTLIFHPDAISSSINAIKNGMDILTDVEMVRAGIDKRLLSKFGGKVICNISGSELSENKTKAESGIERALNKSNNIGIIVIGNAPTALLRTIDILNERRISSIVVIGVPVGFVRAVESKMLLMRQDFPFITNISRKGGSSVAVAIVNAILKMCE